MEINNKNYYEPPSTDSFWELFHYFWDNGIGNELQKNGDPTPWSPEALEEAINHAVNVRSIESWHSHEHLPKLKYVRMICRVISQGSYTRNKVWADCFVKAWRTEERNRRKASKLKPPELPKAAQRLRPLHIILIIAGLVVISGIGYYTYRATQPAPRVTNFKFCTVKQFSEHTKTCRDATIHFPAGTQKIMVSFQLHNMFQGDTFKRHWFRNGKKFITRNEYVAAPWEGYTYIYNRHGHDLGEYTLRVIINGKVTAKGFTVGDVK